MRRLLACLGSSLVLSVAAAFGGCGSGSSATTTTGTGGLTGQTTVTDTATTGAGGGSTCVGPMPDGVCDLQNGEDCNCVDCQDTAFCNPGQCQAGGDSCDHLYDSCTCAICAEDRYCGDPTRGNCKDGGACDPFVEGCHCPNCWTDPACQGSVAACAGGQPDGTCDRTKEDCSCVDCQGTPLCIACQNTGTCDTNEPCYCPDCVNSKLCSDAMQCVDDGVCAALTEGCLCNDCKDLPECAPKVADAGADAADGG